jgi:hypothetical protein
MRRSDCGWKIKGQSALINIFAVLRNVSRSLQNTLNEVDKIVHRHIAVP